jgi:hypothetical protein
MTNNHRGIGLVQVIWILAGFLAIVTAGWHMVGNMRDSSVHFSTPYQAVLLTNGADYFGHLSGYGGQFPVLTEVYYVVSRPIQKPSQGDPSKSTTCSLKEAENCTSRIAST